jgi:putative ABC transport system substrate-binding protein
MRTPAIPATNNFDFGMHGHLSYFEIKSLNWSPLQLGRVMRRREFIGLIGGAAGVAAAGIRAKAEDNVRRVGALITTPTAREVLEKVLAQRGWVLGRNLQIDYRMTGGETERSRQGARELIAERPDVIFATTNTSIAALQAEGSRIPTVFAMVSDPVGMHYIESFAHPGGNVTGFTPFEPSLGGKWVSLLKEIAPEIDRLGIIYNPEPGNNAAAFRASIDEIAKKTGITSIQVPQEGRAGIERLILSMKNVPNCGLVFLPDAITAVLKDRMIAVVAECRIPTVYSLRLFCDAGGLISYGPDLRKMYAGAAAYVDQILRGANPAEMPVQAPTEFELIVNQKTAKQLGVRVPNTVLARADDVIE